MHDGERRANHAEGTTHDDRRRLDIIQLPLASVPSPKTFDISDLSCTLCNERGRAIHTIFPILGNSFASH